MATDFTLRGFLAEVERQDAREILRIRERVGLDYDVTAVALELEQAGRAPVLWFDDVGGSPFPVVTNVFGARRRYALALGVPEARLIDEWVVRGDARIAPVAAPSGPVQDVVVTGKDVDLGRLPILNHFDCDGGRYITNGIIVAQDPDSGVRNTSFHRMQVKGKNRLGTSLHSRRDLWNYVQRAEERGVDTPIAVVVGAHPTFTFGGLWKGPITTDEYEVVGGLQGAPLETVRARTVPIDVPAHAEFVLEGRILCKAREPEGPFAEFTGYASARSTEHVVEISAITHRKDAVWQSIVAGISDEHTSLLAVPQEARLLRTLRTHMPNVTAVAYPKSGTCRLHAYIAMRKPAPGQAKNAAAVALGDDLSLKLVIVVDDDVDVRSDFDVLWAAATRMQADEDVDVIRHAMGAILDPSNHAGVTAKMIIDATRPSADFPARHTLPKDAIERARALIARASN
ncbi:MAG TPA: UbiD family decarboxylase [Candidatus Sulfotelmatobacter sp.]|nr:UbiD family decarboxylase [Candidatus Sulfotelmatobacter sp.]